MSKAEILAELPKLKTEEQKERGLQAAETSLTPEGSGQTSQVVPIAPFCSLEAALLPFASHE